MSMDAEGRLALVRTKVERAKNNLRDLEIDLGQFYDANPEWQDSTARTLAIGQDDYGRFHLPFDCLAAAGDVINNLRSALDHLVYQLVLAHDPEVDSGILERSGFPICENRQSYKKAKRKLKGIHPLAVEAIDKLKPYKDGNPQLWLLNELNNINKHRLLLTVGEIVMCHATWIGEISFSNEFMYKTSDPHFTGIFASGVDRDLDLTSERALVGPEILGGQALIPTLHQLVKFIDNLVRAFRPHFG